MEYSNKLKQQIKAYLVVTLEGLMKDGVINVVNKNATFELALGRLGQELELTKPDDIEDMAKKIYLMY